jgi:hypothetical protein
VPLSDDDREMAHSWKCVPVPPDASGIWVAVDDSKDNATGWCRRDRCVRHEEMQDRLLTKPEALAIAAPVKKKRRRRKPLDGQLDFWRKN